MAIALLLDSEIFANREDVSQSSCDVWYPHCGLVVYCQLLPIMDIMLIMCHRTL